MAKDPEEEEETGKTDEGGEAEVQHGEGEGEGDADRAAGKKE